MICPICRQAEIIDGLTTVKFERGELGLRINNVPASVCPSCGEAYVEEQVTLRLLQRAHEIHKLGIPNADHEYSTIEI